MKKALFSLGRNLVLSNLKNNLFGMISLTLTIISFLQYLYQDLNFLNLSKNDLFFKELKDLCYYTFGMLSTLNSENELQLFIIILALLFIILCMLFILLAFDMGKKRNSLNLKANVISCFNCLLNTILYYPLMTTLLKALNFEMQIDETSSIFNLALNYYIIISLILFLNAYLFMMNFLSFDFRGKHFNNFGQSSNHSAHIFHLIRFLSLNSFDMNLFILLPIFTLLTIILFIKLQKNNPFYFSLEFYTWSVFMLFISMTNISETIAYFEDEINIETNFLLIAGVISIYLLIVNVNGSYQIDTIFSEFYFGEDSETIQERYKYLPTVCLSKAKAISKDTIEIFISYHKEIIDKELFEEIKNSNLVINEEEGILLCIVYKILLDRSKAEMNQKTSKIALCLFLAELYHKKNEFLNLSQILLDSNYNLSFHEEYQIFFHRANFEDDLFNENGQLTFDNRILLV